jgi:hypothetical protein
MLFDEQYVPLLQQANLFAVANIVCRDMLVFNTTTIMVMVYRWRPETHSFDLPCNDVLGFRHCWSLYYAYKCGVIHMCVTNMLWFIQLGFLFAFMILYG